MLYELAVTSGLRAGELRSLAWDCFDLSDDPPTVTVRAAYSKYRRDDTLPLKASTAQMLARWRDESGPVDREHPVFAMPEKTATMIRADLADADIEYRDADGRVCDFHALRHSFVSALARGGVHPKVAQQLARHSTITLTMDRYSHTVVGELAAGLHALPDLSPRPDAERLRATGTADRLPFSLPLSLPKSLPTRGARGMSPCSSSCTESVSAATVTRPANPTKAGVSCASVRDQTPGFVGRKTLRRGGLEPSTVGLEIRCSIHLSYRRCAGLQQSRIQALKAIHHIVPIERRSAKLPPTAAHIPPKLGVRGQPHQGVGETADVPETDQKPRLPRPNRLRGAVVIEAHRRNLGEQTLDNRPRQALTA